jgi:hypothetical protein
MFEVVVRLEMRLWLSGELQGNVAEPYIDVARRLRNVVKPQLLSADYGQAVGEWALVAIVTSRQNNWLREAWQFIPPRGLAEFRLKVDYRAFLEASDAERHRLLYSALLRSCSLAESLKIPSFHPEQFHQDLLRIGTENDLV